MLSAKRVRKKAVGPERDIKLCDYGFGERARWAVDPASLQ